MSTYDFDNKSRYNSGYNVDYNTSPSGQISIATLNTVMRQVYLKMFVGLLVTGLVSLLGYSTGFYYNIVASMPSMMWIPMLAWIIMMLVIQARIGKMKSSTATLLFFLSSALLGFALTSIFYAYQEASIAKTFFITSATFGAMSIYGYFTEKDLTSWGSFLIYALFGLIIVSVVNIFTKSDTLGWIISGAGVLIFIGLTAYDTQAIKRMAQQMPAEYTGHVSTIGAIQLYLDFVNLFLYLLRFFGKRR